MSQSVFLLDVSVILPKEQSEVRVLGPHHLFHHYSEYQGSDQKYNPDTNLSWCAPWSGKLDLQQLKSVRFLHCFPVTVLLSCKCPCHVGFLYFLLLMMRIAICNTNFNAFQKSCWKFVVLVGISSGRSCAVCENLVPLPCLEVSLEMCTPVLIPCVKNVWNRSILLSAVCSCFPYFSCSSSGSANWKKLRMRLCTD